MHITVGQTSHKFIQNFQIKFVCFSKSILYCYACKNLFFLRIFKIRNRDSVLSILPTLWPGSPGVQFPAVTREFSQITSSPALGLHSQLFSRYRVFLGGKSGRGVKFTTRLHPAPRLRMSGAKHLLPLYDFKLSGRWKRNFFLKNKDRS